MAATRRAATPAELREYADYASAMDERQKHVHENFSSSSKLSDPVFVQKLMDWITFWRRNPSRFVQYYFGVILHLYQHIILFLMDIYPSICIVAARSAAKSFIIAIYACKEAILRPGAKIVVASATKKQARLIVSEKIEKEILPNSPLLQQEILKIRDSQNEIEVVFRNGSSIVVVPANDNARGYRATVMIYEEFRMILKNIIDTVLSPFLYVRQVPFILKYEEYSFLAEEPKSIYISSAWYKNHWMWDHIKNIVKGMLQKDNSILIAMDYSIALKHNIKPRSFLIKERTTLDAVAWAIEYENQMVAENAHAYFTYEMLNKNRVLKRPFYPRKNEDVLDRVKGNKYAIPRQKGEIRIIACDIAPEGGEGNDNSIFSCIRALPESMEYKTSDVNGDHIEVKQGYRRQVVYMEPQTDHETTHQAIRIKQLFADFDADYCVLDTRNAGVSVFDQLAKVLYDVERNVEYEPWTCMNDEKLKERIVIAGQKEVVFSIKAQLETNSKIAVCMKTTLNRKMIELMVNNQEGIEELQRLVPEYAEADVETQLFYERPFLETVALINEMISLEYTVQNQTGLIKIEEKQHARKDRYTSVSYGNYFIELLEQELFSDSSGYDYVPLCN